MTAVRAAKAAKTVEQKFTRSLPNQPRLSAVAPRKLSKMRPARAPNRASAAWALLICKAQIPLATTSTAASVPASVPTRLTAPSVPGATRRNVVIKNGWPPKIEPTSDETVSAAASAIAARSIVPRTGAAVRMDGATLETRRASGARAPARPRLAITCAALRPCGPSARPRVNLRVRLRRVARNEQANMMTRGTAAEWKSHPEGWMVQLVMRKQMMPPQLAAGVVPARRSFTRRARVALRATIRSDERAVSPLLMMATVKT